MLEDGCDVLCSILERQGHYLKTQLELFVSDEPQHMLSQNGVQTTIVKSIQLLINIDSAQPQLFLRFTQSFYQG